jgi:hypothetical protein
MSQDLLIDRPAYIAKLDNTLNSSTVSDMWRSLTTQI